jgi:hypothetical protein
MEPLAMRKKKASLFREVIVVKMRLRHSTHLAVQLSLDSPTHRVGSNTRGSRAHRVAAFVHHKF